MGKLIVAVALVLVIFFVVAFVVYAGAAAVWKMQPPAGASPRAFLASVLVTKLGHAIAFVVLFHLARSSLGSSWPTYAFVWWLMFVIGEGGQAIGPNYSWREAVAGVVAESIYFPAAGVVTHWLVAGPRA